MSIETVTLAIMKDRKGFEELHPLIDRDTTDPKQVRLMAGFEEYYRRHQSHVSVDFAVFLPWFFKAAGNSMTADDKAIYTAVITSIAGRTVDDDTRLSIREDIHTLNMATRMANLIAAFENGEAPDFVGDVSSHLDAYNVALETATDAYIPIDLAGMMKEEADNSGIQWRMPAINQAMRPLRPGDFGIIAGRPDKGKTSFLTDNLTYMAQQLKPEDNILWLNNEGPGAKINFRLVQSALAKSGPELVRMGLDKARTAYIKAVGRLDRIRVMDCHGYTNHQVERLIANNSPAIVVFDMIDNIRGFGDAARTDLALERMYQWARERAVKFGTINIGTSQISNEGDGLPYPTLGMLKDSKTGKQGASDFQLMIGSSNDDGQSNTRWISLPKNKLRVAGSQDLRQECIFERDHGRYSEITFVDEPVEHGGPNAA